MKCLNKELTSDLHIICDLIAHKDLHDMSRMQSKIVTNDALCSNSRLNMLNCNDYHATSEAYAHPRILCFSIIITFVAIVILAVIPVVNESRNSGLAKIKLDDKEAYCDIIFKGLPKWSFVDPSGNYGIAYKFDNYFVGCIYENGVVKGLIYSRQDKRKWSNQEIKCILGANSAGCKWRQSDGNSGAIHYNRSDNSVAGVLDKDGQTIIINYLSLMTNPKTIDDADIVNRFEKMGYINCKVLPTVPKHLLGEIIGLYKANDCENGSDIAAIPGGKLYGHIKQHSIDFIGVEEPIQNIIHGVRAGKNTDSFIISTQHMVFIFQDFPGTEGRLHLTYTNEKTGEMFALLVK